MLIKSVLLSVLVLHQVRHHHCTHRHGIHRAHTFADPRKDVMRASKTLPPSSTDPITVSRQVWTEVVKSQDAMRYIMVTQGNAAMVPMMLNWMCNTKHMLGVHQRTVVVMSDKAGYDSLAHSAYNVAVAEMRSQDSDLARNQNFGQYGYWKLNEARVEMLSSLLHANVSFILWEPDALWLRTPLGDAELIAASQTVDLAVMSEITPQGVHMVAFGFVMVTANARTQHFFDHLSATLSLNVRNLGPHNMSDTVPLIPALLQEQEIANTMLRDGFANVTHRTLSPCVYSGGLWYIDAEVDRRRDCILKRGVPVLINNNWIVGNAAKIERAKAWGHWFVGDDGTCDERRIVDAVTKHVWPPGVRGAQL
jgi:hypothetical protein